MRQIRSGMYEGLHVKYSRPIFIKLEFSNQIFTKYSNIKFHENPSSGAQLFHADRETDMKKPTVAFHNFANTPKNQKVTFFIIKCNGEWSNMSTKMSKICNTSTSLCISHCVTVRWRFYPTTMVSIPTSLSNPLDELGKSEAQSSTS
jgi:hypothetical protein